MRGLRVRFARRLTRFHADRRGQIAPLAVIGMLPLVMLLGIIFNTSEQIVDKTRVQNAVDAAVMTQATWTARSLNVMSMNNVAITQAHAINVISVTLLPELIELSIESVQKFREHLQNGQRCVQAAAACGPFSAACIAGCVAVFGGLLAHLTIVVIKPLIDIWQDLNIPIADFVFKPVDLLTGGSPDLPDGTTSLGLISDFAQMGQALVAMNDYVAKESKNFAKQTVTNVSTRNGLTPFDSSLFLYAGYSQTDPYGLPVEEVAFGSEGSGSDVGSLASGIGREICKTGYWGTAFFDPTGSLLSVDFNFQEHGYEWYKGPFEVGRASVSAAIEKPRDALTGFPHFGDSPSARFDNLIRASYPAACSLRQFVTFPSGIIGQFTPYRVAGDPGARSALSYNDRDSRDTWSIFGIGKMQRPEATVMSGWFVNDPDAVYATAQAEVYNGVWYDLYTQDWHAKLVSTHMLEGDIQDKLITEVEDFDASLYQLLRDAKPVLGAINAH